VVTWRRGAETWGFHESPSFPEFLSLGRVSHECPVLIPTLKNVSKDRRDFFQRESNQRVLRESCSFT